MSRLDNIENYGKQQNIEADIKAQEQARIQAELVEKILQLSPRVKELIETANACRRNGIAIHTSNERSPRDFMADGITHKIGFNIVGGNSNNIITDIRICAGGAAGTYGISTNGEEVYGVHENEDYKEVSQITKYPPQIGYMREFLERFDSFETRFYNYVDEITKPKLKGYEHYKALGLTEERYNQMMQRWNTEEQIDFSISSWGIDQTNKGYAIFNEDTIAEIQRLDDVGAFMYDEEAALQAEKDGIKIIPVEELPAIINYRLARYIDTPENRERISKHSKDLAKDIEEFIVEVIAQSANGSRYIYFYEIEEHFDIELTESAIEEIEDICNGLPELLEPVEVTEDSFSFNVGLAYLTDIEYIREANEDVFSWDEEENKVFEQYKKYSDSSLYNNMQLVQIYNFLANDFDISLIENPEMSWQEMREIREQEYAKKQRPQLAYIFDTYYSDNEEYKKLDGTTFYTREEAEKFLLEHTDNYTRILVERCVYNEYGVLEHTDPRVEFVEVITFNDISFYTKRAFYISKYEDAWNECYQKAIDEAADDPEYFATIELDKTANAQEIVGRYLIHYEGNPLGGWLENIQEITLSNQDRDVTVLLADLFTDPDMYLRKTSEPIDETFTKYEKSYESAPEDTIRYIYESSNSALNGTVFFTRGDAEDFLLAHKEKDAIVKIFINSELVRYFNYEYTRQENYQFAYEYVSTFYKNYAEVNNIEIYDIVEDSYQYEHGLMLLSYDNCKEEYLNGEDCSSTLELVVDLDNVREHQYICVKNNGDNKSYMARYDYYDDAKDFAEEYPELGITHIESTLEFYDGGESTVEFPLYAGNFIDDEEKMNDFVKLTKEEFLQSYSYITEEEYDNTEAFRNDTKHYIWKYIFNSQEEVFDFNRKWAEMFSNGEACMIPEYNDYTCKTLEVHALINTDNGYYEQWTVNDCVDYAHDFFTNIISFPNEYNGNHPVCNSFFDGEKWIDNTPNYKEQYKDFTVEKVDWKIYYNDKIDSTSHYLVYKEIGGEKYYLAEQTAFDTLDEAWNHIDSVLDPKPLEVIINHYAEDTNFVVQDKYTKENYLSGYTNRERALLTSEAENISIEEYIYRNCIDDKELLSHIDKTWETKDKVKAPTGTIK